MCCLLLHGTAGTRVAFQKVQRSVALQHTEIHWFDSLLISISTTDNSYTSVGSVTNKRPAERTLPDANIPRLIQNFLIFNRTSRRSVASVLQAIDGNIISQTVSQYHSVRSETGVPPT
jgi:hypothetical protein